MAKRLTYSYVNKYIESFGYKLLSKEYKNSSTKLEIQCDKGHVYQVIFGSFKNGCRCPVCKGGVKLTYDIIKNEIEKTNYKLLSKEYQNSHNYLDFECPKNHKFKMFYNSFQQGRRCPICNKIKNIEKQKHPYEYIKNQIENHGYKLLSKEYINIFEKLKVQCPVGHIYYVHFNNFKYGKRCPTCNYNSLSSNTEKKIQKYIKSIYKGKILNNDRNIIINPLTNKYLELDVYLPELNKAIEYNGTYWHSDPYQKFKDNIKKEECKKLNIDLFVIEEQSWIKNESECLNKIKKFLL